jgi:hypothetical protein
MESISSILEDRVQVLIPVVLVLSAVLIISSRFSGSGYDAFPLLGQEFGNSDQRRKGFLKDAKKLYQEGYARFKNQPFRLTTTDGT